MKTREELIKLVGQRMLVGFPDGPVISDALRRLVKNYKVGNFILFSHNVTSREQMRDLCAELQQMAMESTGVPAFIAADQEGGAVVRLPKDCASIPCAMALSASGDPANTYLAGKITAQELKALGCNFDLAPVMDVNSNPLNPVIGARSYGDTPEVVCEYGVQMMHGLHAGGVLSCAKHFPGHGDTAVDSHLGLPKVDKSLEELEACELKPFRAAIEAGVSAVMTTHILFPQLDDSGVPATMSRKIITGILREKLGFDRLVVSDCMMMQAIAKFYGTVAGTVAACKAGVDLICICHDPDLVAEAIEAVVAGIMDGSIDLAECEASVQRIMDAKAKLATLPEGEYELVGCDEFKTIANDLRLKSLTHLGQPIPKLGDKPFFVGCYPFQTTLAANPEDRRVAFPQWMQEKMGGTYLSTAIDPDDAEIAAAVEAAKDATSIVLGTYNAHMKPGQTRLMQALAKLNKPYVCVALRNPYDLKDLPENASGILAYEYRNETMQHLVDIFNGEKTCQGKLHIKL